MKKAVESFLDKGSQDSGFDFLTGRSLSRDHEVLRMEHLQRVHDRERVSVASNYFALACPIMPIGVLALFSFLGKFGAVFDKDPDAEKLESEQAQRQRGELTQALYLAAMRKRMEAQGRLDTGLQCSKPVDSFLTTLGPAERAARKKRKEISLMLDGKPSEQINGPKLLSSRAQNEVSKLVKTKMQLESHLERMSQEQDFGAVCRVSARIELLEKALKRLGC